MKLKTGLPLVAAFTFVWIGFVLAISFVEAPLKFQAPGITLSLGLGIGRLVFGTMNKMEWLFAVIILLSILPFTTNSYKEEKQKKYYFPILLFFIPFSVLIIQSAWLLPALNERADMIIKGVNLPSSSIHYYYVVAECIKLASLFSFGITQFI